MYRFGALPRRFYRGLLVQMKRCLHTHLRAFSVRSSARQSGLESQGQIYWTPLAASYYGGLRTIGDVMAPFVAPKTTALYSNFCIRPQSPTVLFTFALARS